MSKRYDLEIELAYSSRTGYNRLLKPHEWVRGMPVELSIRVTNKSSKEFPGTRFTASVTEFGASAGSRPLAWGIFSELGIPRLKPGQSAAVPLTRFSPLVEGISAVSLELDAPAGAEVWVTGWRQAKPEQSAIAFYYTVVGWQELEIIKLLRESRKEGYHARPKRTTAELR